MSNCSQRVRLVLEEKAVDWTSHIIDLAKNEHLTDDYQQLNPGGTVPTLVHDGKVVTDSNEILVYIDERFPAPPLAPVGPGDKDRVEDFLEMSSKLQEHLKLLTFTYLIPPQLAKKTPRKMAEYASLQRNKELVDWMQRFSDGGFSQDDLEEARVNFLEDLKVLDQHLQHHDWLSGSEFGIADISWTVNVHRASLIAAATGGILDPNQFKNVGQWFLRVSNRPSFDKALTAY